MTRAHNVFRRQNSVSELYAYTPGPTSNYSELEFWLFHQSRDLDSTFSSRCSSSLNSHSENHSCVVSSNSECRQRRIKYEVGRVKLFTGHANGKQPVLVSKEKGYFF